jgi:hypothetical protein
MQNKDVVLDNGSYDPGYLWIRGQAEGDGTSPADFYPVIRFRANVARQVNYSGK